MLLLSWILLGAALPHGGDEKGKSVTSVRLKPNVSVRGLDVTIGELCDLPADATGLTLGKIRFGRSGSCRA